MKSTLWRLALRFLAPPEERALVRAAQAAITAQAHAAFAPSEVREWGKVLSTEFGRKLDAALCNWCTERAWLATQAPAREVEKAAGFALGARTAWEVAKSISRMGEAQSPESETPAPTVAQGLEQHQP
jgi:hypothetical protein